MASIKKYWKAGAFMLAYVAVMAFLMRHDPQMPIIILVVLGLVAGVVAMGRFPGLTCWAEANAGLVRLLGLAVIITGPAVVIFGIFYAGLDGTDVRATGICIVFILVGALIFTLPRFNRDKAISKEMIAGAPAPAVAGANLPNEVYASFAFLRENLPAFFRVSAPWLALNLALNLAAAHIMALPRTGDGLRNGEIAFLVAYLFIAVFAMPAVAVAWHRYVMCAELPAWGLVPPNKRFWRYFYRLWLFGFLVTTMDKIVASSIPDIARFTGAAAAKVIDSGLEDAVLLLAVWGAGMYALVLPAVAVGDREVDITVALRLIWPRRLQFATGFLATVLAFYLVIITLDLVQGALADGRDFLPVTFGVLSFTLLLGAVAASATYLSRAYMRAKVQPLPA